MITAVVYDIRRMLRWRLSWLVPATPIFAVIGSKVSGWFGRPINPAIAIGVILASSAVLFVRFMLSDAEGKFKWVFVTSPARRWTPLVRLVLLFTGPFLLQLAIYHFGISLRR
jgi:hypothetical protein